MMKIALESPAELAYNDLKGILIYGKDRVEE